MTAEPRDAEDAKLVVLARSAGDAGIVAVREISDTAVIFVTDRAGNILQ